MLFLSLDASRLPAVLAARSAGIPYVWSRCRPLGRARGAEGPAYGYDVERFHGQAHSRFTVLPDQDLQADDELSLELTARFGAHATLAGRTVFVPNSHRPWPLHPARLVDFEDGLLASAGFALQGPPDSVLFSPGVRTVFGLPRRVRKPVPGGPG